MSEITGPGRRRRVILESPFAGDTGANMDYARACLRDCLDRGEAPFASHLLYTQPGALRDDVPEQRRMGIDAGLAWGEAADATVVYGDLGVSGGMRDGIRDAESAGRPIERRSLPGWAPAGEQDPLARYCRAVRETAASILHAARAADAAAARAGTPDMSGSILLCAESFLHRAAERLCDRGKDFGLPLDPGKAEWFSAALMGARAAWRTEMDLAAAADAWQPGQIRGVCRDSDRAAAVRSLRAGLHGEPFRVALEGRMLTLRPRKPMWHTRRQPTGTLHVSAAHGGAAGRQWCEERLSGIAWLARRRNAAQIAPEECLVQLPDVPPFRMDRSLSLPPAECLRNFGRVCPEIGGCRPQRCGAIQFTLRWEVAAALREDRAAWEEEARTVPGLPARRGGENPDVGPAAAVAQR